MLDLQMRKPSVDEPPPGMWNIDGKGKGKGAAGHVVETGAASFH